MVVRLLRYIPSLMRVGAGHLKTFIYSYNVRAVSIDLEILLMKFAIPAPRTIKRTGKRTSASASVRVRRVRVRLRIYSVVACFALEAVVYVADGL